MIQVTDISRHFEATHQVRIARLTAHLGLVNTMGLVRRRKTGPLLDHRFAVLLFCLHAFVRRNGPKTFL